MSNASGTGHFGCCMDWGTGHDDDTCPCRMDEQGGMTGDAQPVPVQAPPRCTYGPHNHREKPAAEACAEKTARRIADLVTVGNQGSLPGGRGTAARHAALVKAGWVVVDRAATANLGNDVFALTIMGRQVFDAAWDAIATAQAAR
jgi:hypothetical protein